MKQLHRYMAVVLSIILLAGAVAMSGCQNQEGSGECEHDYVNGVCSQCGQKQEVSETERPTEDETEAGEDPAPDIDTSVSEGKESVDKNGIKYVYKGNRTCIVSGVTKDFQMSTVTIPEKNPDGDTVIGIGDHAFENCFDLTEISLPDSVTAIGEQAFRNCSSLKSIVLPEGVAKLGDGAFEGCLKLETVTLSKDLQSVPAKCFRNCASLTGIALHDRISFIGEEAFYNCTTLGEVSMAGVTYVGKSAFERCLELKEIVFPATIRQIDAHAFRNCPGLRSVSFSAVEDPQSQTVIGEAAFKNNRSLVSVQLSDAIVQIGDSAFEKCEAVEELTLPTDLTAIGMGTFRDCSALKKLNIGEDSALKTIGDSAFAGCLSLESLALPAGLEAIDSSAFYNCSALQEVTFPTGDGALSIGSYAFCGCEQLERLFFDNTETNIGGSAFLGCTELGAIDLNSDLMHIDDRAFASCSKLESVYVQGGLVLGADVFDETPLPITQYANGSYLGTELNPYMILIGYDVPDSFEKIDVILHRDTATITGNAFREIAEDSRFTEIVIPSGIGSLGDEVFIGCKYLKKVVFTAGNSMISIGNRAFYRCEALETIELPESLLEIKNEAFDGCISLTSVKIPATLHTLGEAAFRGCSSLKTVEFAEVSALTAFEPSVFEACTSMESASIPDSVESIGSSAFQGCTCLKNIMISERTSLQAVAATALADCPNVAYSPYQNGLYLGNVNKPYTVFVAIEDRLKDTVTLHEDTILIADEALKDSSALKTLHCPSNSALRRIGDRALYGCGNLSELYIPAGVTDIGEDALRGCGSLTGIFVSAANQRYASNDHCLIEVATKVLLRGCSQSRIPDDGSVEVIGAYAFDGCADLQRIEIPQEIVKIEGYAFARSGLKYIDYYGNQDAWKAMERDEHWSEDASDLSYVLCGEKTLTPAEFDD